MSGKVLILTDGKARHENQSRAFARALGMVFDVVEVHSKSKFAKAKSYLLDRFGKVSLGLLDFEGLKPSQYRAVIGTGSGTFYTAKSSRSTTSIPVRTSSAASSRTFPPTDMSAETARSTFPRSSPAPGL